MRRKATSDRYARENELSVEFPDDDDDNDVDASHFENYGTTLGGLICINISMKY